MDVAKEFSLDKISPWWRHTTILVLIFGFTILIIMTIATYTYAPPIPERNISEQGQTLFLGADINKGQELFLKYALMEHGTLWGHGAYLGPDYSAEYLHRTAEIGQDYLANVQYGKNFLELSIAEQGAISFQIQKILKTNRYDPQTNTLVLSKIEEESFSIQVKEWTKYFASAEAAPGLPANYIPSEDIKPLTAFFAWASWASVTNRPGKDYTYTNNFPHEPLVGNKPSVQSYIWSAISLIFLLAGIGAVLLAFGRFDYLGWAQDSGKATRTIATVQKTLTPSQRFMGEFFIVVVILFLAQTLIGGALAHYKVEPGSFYGLNITQWLPYNLLRTWHLQLAIFWIATAWVAGGLFLAPLIGGKEPAGQKLGSVLLLLALFIVVVGSIAGEYLGINNLLGNAWFWLGHQGSEYLDLGRFWQILLAVGLVFWLILMYRALAPAIKDPSKSTLTSLFLYSAIAIPLFYLPALFYGPHTNFAIIDNWRFWIIHLWVEGFFELFATVLVAIIFTTTGLVTAIKATRVVYLDAILYLMGGIVGTAHHWYFTGQPMISLALGSCFSALEIVPLTLLTYDAWDFVKVTRSPGNTNYAAQTLLDKQKYAFYFLISVGFWNFVGAGIFGFLINLPIISYFEIGTTLTSNHGHAAMFGVFGMLALAVVVFCMRSMQSDAAWQKTEKFIKVGFWGLNIGLALMLILDLFPGGVLQLWDSMENGYWHARRLTFTMHGLFHTLEWVRIGADTLFLVGGVLPIFIGIGYAFFNRDIPVKND